VIDRRFQSDQFVCIGINGLAGQLFHFGKVHLLAPFISFGQSRSAFILPSQIKPFNDLTPKESDKSKNCRFGQKSNLFFGYLCKRKPRSSYEERGETLCRFCSFV
jgi:hypothetical protein